MSHRAGYLHLPVSVLAWVPARPGCSLRGDRPLLGTPLPSEVSPLKHLGVKSAVRDGAFRLLRASRGAPPVIQRRSLGGGNPRAIVLVTAGRMAWLPQSADPRGFAKNHPRFLPPNPVRDFTMY